MKGFLAINLVNITAVMSIVESLLLFKLYNFDLNNEHLNTHDHLRSDSFSFSDIYCL